MKTIAFVHCIFQFVHYSFGEKIFIQTTNAGNIGGRIQEINGKSYSVFQAIPFAKPPVGNLRFRDPEPLSPKPVSESVDASRGFSKTCIQAFEYSSTDQSEDCLYLNVFSPKTENSDNAKYPVMVWIHGGAFVLGSAKHYSMEGTLRNIVSRGVVFVSINYRLGTFGFFSTRSSAAKGNYGLLDQVEALRWVKQNILAFGGDPAQVTIFGESAGGASVSLLTISPLTEGLFNQAILMSGSALAPWVMMYDSDPQDVSGDVSISVGCRENVSKPSDAMCPYRENSLQEVPPEISKQHEMEMDCLRSKEVEEIASQPSAILMRPRIDGRFLPEAPELMIKKRKPYKLMMGVVQAEMAPFKFFNLPGFATGIALTENEFHSSGVLMDCKTFKFPELVNLTVNNHYANSMTPEGSDLDKEHFWFQQSVKRDSGLMFVAPVYQDAIEALNTNSEVYIYSYDYQNAVESYDPNRNFSWKGPGHGSELYSLFDTNSLGFFSRSIAEENSVRDDCLDHQSAEVWGKLVTNFAKFGNPTPSDSTMDDGVTWQPFSKSNGEYLSIDLPKVKMASKFYEEDMKLWTYLVPALQDSVTCK